MKLFKLALVPMILMMASGCLKVEQTLTISKDGAAVMDMSYGMQEETIAQMEAMSKMSKQMADSMGEEADTDDNSFEFDPEQVRREYKELEQYGITLDDVSSELKDGWKYMNVKFSADDMSALGKAESMEGSSVSLKKNPEGNYVLEMNSAGPDMGGDTEGMTPEMKEMMMQTMLPMVKGMRVVMNIVAPGRILDSNATEVDGNKASWIFDVDKDPSFIAEIDKMSMRLVFDGEGLDLKDVTAVSGPEE